MVLHSDKGVPQHIHPFLCESRTFQAKAFAVQVQGNLSESAGRADLQEQALAKLKVKGRAASVQPH